MKQKIWAVLMLLSISIVGCGSGSHENADRIASLETNETLATQSEEGVEEDNVSVGGADESVSDVELDSELVEYNYEDLYLSVELPEGWEYEIQTAEELAMEDGLVTCAIDFWSTEYPDTVFELGYQSPFGLCLTGVTVEYFTLSNGLGGYRYTEIMDDVFWMNITIANSDNNLSGGSYVISAAPKLVVWENIKEEFKQILDTVWVGPKKS